MKSEPQSIRISDSDLCLLIRSDEKNGAMMLYDTYANFLLLCIIRIVRDRKLAEQVLEQTFIKVWCSIQDYDVDNERIYTWMKAIAINLAKNALLTANKINEDHIKNI